ncbi:mechanosensitive ion channel domain-containing protein [uncultured Thiohalocapsa sp.]|uniref:mechanosensitive ion channel domain-containing protein n=1 Tax=uncultured Thiohalocapsa sp. TaxID=768990 RepID=UPI0025D35636|nr:mechanosensitive ion channel domain-containing protein [uncultured Thiohalocapsa sp.]
MQPGTAVSPAQSPAAEPAQAPAQQAATLPFDPAAVGLPGLAQPLTSAQDLRQALALIDLRLQALEAALEALSADAADAAATHITADATAAADTPAAVDAHGSAEYLEQQMELLRALRLVVQRRATLGERLAEGEAELAQLRAEVETFERDGFAQEPPFPVSQLDQARAELVLTEADEDVAETRLQTATRRLENAERALSRAVSERRAARDRLTAAGDVGDAERAALSQALRLAQLSDLRARQEVAAATSALDWVRVQEDLAAVKQVLLRERVRYLERRVVLPRAALAERLAELTARIDALGTQVDDVAAAGDAAEADLYRARRRLADADADAEAERGVLEAWVETRQTEVRVARNGVDALTAALADLEQMRRLWELRHRLMETPEALDLPQMLAQVRADLDGARNAKDDIVERLSALRSLQLAQARRLRDPSLDEGRRDALTARSAVLEEGEAYGRELLETKDALIALLDGMRHQLRERVQTQSLRIRQVREALVSWWRAELLVIDDQSMRARDLATALVMFLVVVVLVALIRMGARRTLQRRRARGKSAEAGDLRLVLSAIAGNTRQIFVLIAAFYVAMVFSGLATPTVKDWLWTALVIAFYAQLGIWANAAIVDYFNRRRTRQEMRDPSAVTGYGVMMFFIRAGIWVTVVVSLLAYFRYPIAGLLGALGVGTVAVGFALQSILGDVFSSMAIVLDKPFRVGDFIQAGETLGVVEYTGVKTTRIRSLSGEQVVLSNSDLLSSRIHNYKHLKERRVVFRLGVVYETPRAQLERIPDMLRGAIAAQPHARFERAHFVEFGDYALVFEVVYYVLSPDYTVYMDTQQAINLGIHRRFEEAGIAFAFPTQELILRRDAAVSG